MSAIKKQMFYIMFVLNKYEHIMHMLLMLATGHKTVRAVIQHVVKVM